MQLYITEIGKEHPNCGMRTSEPFTYSCYVMSTFGINAVELLIVLWVGGWSIDAYCSNDVNYELQFANSENNF